MDNNDTTLKSYQDHIKDYYAVTPHEVRDDSKSWIDRVLAKIPPAGTVLELGSAFGRDAKYIESKGYKVFASDAVQGFVDSLSKIGFDAKLLNALTDDFGSGHDLVFANAVFLHFSPGELKDVLGKTHQSLKPGGLLAFSVKKGETGSEWSNEKINAPRYFHYWQQADLEPLITDAGFKIIEISEGASRTAKWLQVIAKK